MTTRLILDTDIGTDIDDTWALAMLLNSPEFDLRLVVSSSGETDHRAALAARILEIGERTDVAVGVGVRGEAMKAKPQAAFLGEYGLDDYPGHVHGDGVAALIDTIRSSDEEVAVVSIGPLTNIGEALRRAPDITQNARLIGMHGSVRRGYRDSPEIAPEYNVVCDVGACRTAFAAPWDVLITPLDTCGIVRLGGEPYTRVRTSQRPLARAVIENYRVWLEAAGAPPERIDTHSTTLFDTAAIYLAGAVEFAEIETLPVAVDDEGFTRITPGAREIRVATRWRDYAAFESLVVERLVA